MHHFFYSNRLFRSGFLALMLIFASTSVSIGQIKVELVSEQSEFLPHEPLLIGVRITNQTGKKIKFGKEADWVNFLVERRDGRMPIGKLGEMNVQGEFELDTGKMGTKWFDIMPYFTVQPLAWYKVSAVVKIPELNEALNTPPLLFEVVRGRKIWEQKFGVVFSQADGSSWIQGRKYALVEASSLKHYRLYLRLTDADENRVYMVYSLGPMVSFAQPEAQLDKNNQLHVLTQAGASFFRYYIVEQTGQIVGRQSYEFSNSRPVLRKDLDGKIKVVGGLRRISGEDLPVIFPGETKDKVVVKETQ